MRVSHNVRHRYIAAIFFDVTTRTDTPNDYRCLHGWLFFLHIWRFVVWFQNGPTCWKSNSTVAGWARMIQLRSGSDISPTPPIIFAQGSNISKCGRILTLRRCSFKTKQRIKSTKQTLEAENALSPHQTWLRSLPPTLRIQHCDTARMKNWPVNCV